MVTQRIKEKRRARLAEALQLREQFETELSRLGLTLRTTTNDSHWRIYRQSQMTAELWPSTKWWRRRQWSHARRYTTLVAIVKQLQREVRGDDGPSAPTGVRSRNNGVMWVPLPPGATLRDLCRLIGADAFLRFAREIQATPVAELWRMVGDESPEHPAGP